MNIVQQLQLANQLLTFLSTFSSSSLFAPSAPVPEAERLDENEMSCLIRWMQLFFDNDTPEHDKDDDRPYRQELYNLFVTIRSDYAGYCEHVKYNQSLWLLPSYRRRNLSALVQKIKSDIRMFHQALQLFAFLKNIRA